MERITNDQLNGTFESLVRVARSHGAEPTNWALGQHTGSHYYVAFINPKNGGVTPLSNYWATKRDAYNGLSDMIKAMLLLP